MSIKIQHKKERKWKNPIKNLDTKGWEKEKEKKPIMADNFEILEEQISKRRLGAFAL